MALRRSADLLTNQSEHQAKETAKAYQAAHEGMELATKQDIDLKIETVRFEVASVRREIAELKFKPVVWMAGIAAAAVSFLAWFIENHSKI